MASGLQMTWLLRSWRGCRLQASAVHVIVDMELLSKREMLNEAEPQRALPTDLLHPQGHGVKGVNSC